MTERIERLYAKLRGTKQYPICLEKAEIVTESYKKHDGLPMIIKRAQGLADFCDNKTIFIEDDELLIGNLASKPMGMEVTPIGAAWPDEDLDSILNDGLMYLSDEDRVKLRAMDDYWLNSGRSFDEHRYSYYMNNDRLLTYGLRGINVPAFSRNMVQGSAGDGWGMKNPVGLITPDFGMMLNKGFSAHVAEAKAELEKLHYLTWDDMEKSDFLQATIIAFEGLIRLGRRYAALAAQKAEECADPVRKAELETIAETCRQVPEFPARNFREAMQACTFYWNLLAAGTTGLGRMDQFLYPFYKADIEAGTLTKEEALELLSCFRIKVSQYNFLRGGKFQREKWAGMARWNNIVLAGCDPETGEDATNELSYLFIESANWVRTPHPTMTVRVSKNTPESFLDKAVELVSTGIGLPAFISEDAYIEYLLSRGLDIKEARRFAIAGCLDIALPGKSRMGYVSMSVVPMIMECAMFDGKNPKDGKQIGPQTGYLKDFATYEEFYAAFMKQLDYFIGMFNESSTVKYAVDRDIYPDAVSSGFFHDAIKAGKDLNTRKMPYENGVAYNVVGMANAINSLAALKSIVYEKKLYTPEQMQDALYKNWEGYEELQRLCLDAPKYGNNNDYVDSIGEQFWIDVKKQTAHHISLFGEPVIVSGISISSHAPGGAATGATPDGRRAGETLADGSVSPVPGTDKNGPLAVLQSAMRMSKGWSVNLLNMKLTPSSIKTQEDRLKLGSMIKVYLTNGGKHVQFNVVSSDTLKKAKTDKVTYRDLIVRVAGYSTYYVTLTDRIQNELIARTEHSI